jgi:two-component system sensor histidine kinase MprB
MSLRRRIALVSAATVAVAIACASVLVYFVVRDQLRDQVDDRLRELVSGATVTGVPLGPGRPGLTLSLPTAPLGVPEGDGQLVDSDGKVLRSHRHAPALPVTAATREVAAGTRPGFFSDIELDGSHLRLLTERMAPGEAVQVARSLDDVYSALGRLRLILGLVALAGIGVAALLGRAASRTAVAPVAKLTEAAEHVARTRDLARRIETGEADDEIARLATSFNAMLAELERSVDAQRQLVADASHELRTPLTSLRTNIEVLGRRDGLSEADRTRLIDDLTGQLAELGVLVGNLVDLAREEEPAVDAHELRLDELVGEAVDRARRRAGEGEIEATLEPCLVHGVDERLDRAVQNLLDNAIKWSPPGEVVQVQVTGEGEVEVRDRGPGIAQADLPHVFDRFYRAPGARGTPGSGLGLAIVRQIAEAHGGTVVAERAPGGGTIMRLRLPADDSQRTLGELSAASQVTVVS